MGISLVVKMKKLLLRILFSKKEIKIINDALDDMQCRCKSTLNESCQDTVVDIRKLKRKIPESGGYLYDLE